MMDFLVKSNLSYENRRNFSLNSVMCPSEALNFSYDALKINHWRHQIIKHVIFTYLFNVANCFSVVTRRAQTPFVALEI